MSDSGPGPDDVFDVDRIRRLVELMEQHDLREVDLRQAEQRIRLCRGAEIVMAPPTPMAQAQAAAPQAAAVDASATTSCGRRRETTFETPSPPIVTP